MYIHLYYSVKLFVFALFDGVKVYENYHRWGVGCTTWRASLDEFMT